MILIKIFSSFCDSENCKSVFERLCEVSKIDSYGPDKKIYITTGDDYTHAIIMNTAMPNLTISKKNVVGLAFEPYEFLGITPQFIEYAKKRIGKYYIGEKRQLPSPFIEHFSYMWFSLPKREFTLVDKNIKKPMSIIVSNKRQAPGHIYRHELINEIINNNMNIDIYGSGSKQYNSSQVVGPFEDSEPYEKYFFTISIENYSHNDYISEKFISPMLYNCMPIYKGCKKINKYFPNDSYILLTGNVKEDIEYLKKILENPPWYYRQTNTEENRKTINLIKNISKIYK